MAWALLGLLPALSLAEDVSIHGQLIAICTKADLTVPAPSVRGDAPPSDLARTHPAAALALACRAHRDRPESNALYDVLTGLAVAEALMGLSRAGESASLLSGLPRPSDPPQAVPGWQRSVGVAELLRGRRATDEGKAATAGEHFAQAREFLTRAGDTRSLPYAQTLIGQAQAWRIVRVPGFLDRAPAAVDEAAGLLDALGLGVSLQMSDVLNQRTMLAYARQDLPGAVDGARAELAIYRRLGLADDPEVLDAYASLGALLSQLARFDEAEQAFRDGIRVADMHPGDNPSAHAGMLANLATMLSDQGKLVPALELADRALAVSERGFGTGSARVLRPMTVRAGALAGLGRYADARSAYEAALSVATQHAAQVGPLRRLNLQEKFAALLQELGETHAAQAVLDEAAKTVAGGEQLGYWRGRVLRRSAAMAARAGSWMRADGEYEQAVALIAPVIGESHPYTLDLIAQRCVVQTRGRLTGRSCADTAGLLDRHAIAAPGFRYNALTAIAGHAEAEGRVVEARERYLQALVAAEAEGTPDPLWAAFDQLAMHLRSNGHRRLAVLLGKQSVEQIELMRKQLGADARRYERAFLTDKLGVYRRLADWLTEDGRIAEALDVLQLLKQEEFFDFIQRDGGLLAEPLRRQLLSTAEARALASLPSARPAEGAAAFDGRRVSAWRRFIEVQQDPVDALPSSSVRDLRGFGIPRAGELHVWVYPGERQINLVMTGVGLQEVLRIEADPALLARSVGDVLSSLSRRETALPALQALYRQLGEPIDRAARRLGARHVVLQVDGVLRYLPFASLHDGKAFLGERYAFEQRLVAPGRGSVRAFRGQSVRAVGVTRGMGGLLPLRALAAEVCGIVSGPVVGLADEDTACPQAGQARGLIPGSAWLNEAFTADRLVSAAAESTPRRQNLLHLGTHFVLRPGHMGRSWMQLGDGGRMQLDEMARLDFKGQDLVTLSACETGMGGAPGESSGAEIDGFNTLVLRRGARAVVASLWRVDDESTALLMVSMYRALQRGAVPADALRTAQATVRSVASGRYGHPFYWAGFYLVAAEPAGVGTTP